MQPPMAPPPAAAPAKDNTTLFGVLGIVLGLICCGPAGIVLGILSMQSAKKVGKPQTLGIVAIVASVVGIVINIAYLANR
jgi:K+ transporter